MIKAPNPTNFMNTLGFNVMAIRYNELDLVAAELLDKARVSPETANSFEYQSQILAKHGLSINTLTTDEINYLTTQLGN